MNEPASPAPFALRRASALALVVELVGVVAVFAALSVAAGEPATACGWCATNAFDAAVREALNFEDPRVVALLSHVLSVGVLPALGLSALAASAWRAARRWYGAQDAAIVLNAFLLTTGITDAVKKLADRERPGFHYGRAAVLEAAHRPAEHFLSFFSGDTAWAFVLVAAASTLAHLRGYRVARTLTRVGAPIAVVAGLLRIAADMHWATDVLTGAAVGTAVGVGFPRLLHGRAAARGTTPAA